jgi:hypothetical protein
MDSESSQGCIAKATWEGIAGAVTTTVDIGVAHNTESPEGTLRILADVVAERAQAYALAPMWSQLTDRLNALLLVAVGDRARHWSSGPATFKDVEVIAEWDGAARVEVTLRTSRFDAYCIVTAVARGPVEGRVRPAFHDLWRIQAELLHELVFDKYELDPLHAWGAVQRGDAQWLRARELGAPGELVRVAEVPIAPDHTATVVVQAP